MDNQDTNYGKRPLWQWVLIYLVIGLVLYGLIYYFVLAKRGTSVYNSAPTIPPVASEFSPSATTIPQDTIILTADGFSPADLIVKTGTEVKWINQSGAAATVNSSPHPSPILGP